MSSTSLKGELRLRDETASSSSFSLPPHQSSPRTSTGLNEEVDTDRKELHLELAAESASQIVGPLERAAEAMEVLEAGGNEAPDGEENEEVATSNRKDGQVVEKPPSDRSMMTERELNRSIIKNNIPSSWGPRLACKNERIYSNMGGYFAVSDSFFSIGDMRLLYAPIIDEVCCAYKLMPSQILPNGWRFINGLALLCHHFGCSPSIGSTSSTTWRTELSKIEIWYATFGSNMWRPRFLCYIKGGQVDGMRKPCAGSMDRNLPRETIWKTFPHRLFFGRDSTKTWGAGGVAFLHPESGVDDLTYMCLYRITLEQFNDVLLQENIANKEMKTPAFDLAALNTVENERTMSLELLKNGWYHNVVYLGKENGIPILTMTCSLSDIEKFKHGLVSLRAPSKKYANTLIKGLVEGRQLSEREAAAYIDKASSKPL